MSDTTTGTGPHQGQPIQTAGAPLEAAKAAMVMIHGRGATAADILTLATEFEQTSVAYLAPQAAGQTWYPHRFLEPVSRNEPHLSSALSVIAGLMQRAGNAGIAPERIVLLGFSQGACLASEYAARNPARYGGVVGLSGGLIGADPSPDDYDGSLAGTPVFLGCSDVDAHIPAERVVASAEILRQLDAEVTIRLYPGMAHTVNADEIAATREILAAVLADPA